MVVQSKNYKIRNRSTGLYSRGGASPIRWDKNGKTWKTKGNLTNHLRMHFYSDLDAIKRERMDTNRAAWLREHPGCTVRDYINSDEYRKLYLAAQPTISDIADILPEDWEIVEIILDPKVLPGVPIREYYKENK